MDTDSWNSTTNNVESEVATQPTPPTVILDSPTRNIMDIRDVPIHTEEGQFPVRIDLRYRPYYAVIGLYEPKFMLRCYSCYKARAPKWIKSRSSQLETKEPDPDCTCRRIYVPPEEGDDKSPMREFHLNPYAARENGGTVLRAYPQLQDMLDCRNSADIRRAMKETTNVPQPEIWYEISEPYNPDGTVRITNMHGMIQIRRYMSEIEANYTDNDTVLHHSSWTMLDYLKDIKSKTFDTIQSIYHDRGETEVFTMPYLQGWESPDHDLERAEQAFNTCTKLLRLITRSTTAIEYIINSIWDQNTFLDETHNLLPKHWLHHEMYTSPSIRKWTPRTVHQLRDILLEVKTVHERMKRFRAEFLRPKTTPATPPSAAVILASTRSREDRLAIRNIRRCIDDKGKMTLMESYMVILMILDGCMATLIHSLNHCVVHQLIESRRFYVYGNIAKNLAEALKEKKVQARSVYRPDTPRPYDTGTVQYCAGGPVALRWNHM